MKLALAIGISIVVGILVTLATGLYNSTPNIVGATWYGLPLAWLYVIVYPGNPWSIDWVNFAVDFVLWFIVALAVILLLTRRKRTG
jgi:hypothetical protein